LKKSPRISCVRNPRDLSVAASWRTKHIVNPSELGWKAWWHSSYHLWKRLPFG
jgi:hypothetical protein